MSQDIKMKPAKRSIAKKVELSWIEVKVYHISVLFLLITTVLVGLSGLAIHYGIFESGTIVIENAHAADFQKVAEEAKKVEIVDCETAIEAHAPKYGAPVDLMKRIMDSESGNQPTVENKVSTATGCFQWVIGSWRHFGKDLWKDEFYAKNIYNPSDNTELAAYVISKYGTGDWDASRSKWAK